MQNPGIVREIKEDRRQGFQVMLQLYLHSSYKMLVKGYQVGKVTKMMCTHFFPYEPMCFNML